MKFLPQHILVPIALGPDSDDELAQYAVDAACAIASRFKARITLLSLAPFTAGSNAAEDATGTIYHAIVQAMESQLENARTQMQIYESLVREKGISVDSRVDETALPLSNAICDVASELNVDLIVLGSHGRKGLKRVFLGSVAERVVHLSSAPVLLLGHKMSG